MGKPCRLTFQSFKEGENNLGEAYQLDDLLNSREYCSWLLSEGYKYEPHDGFDLQKFVEWANSFLLNKK